MPASDLHRELRARGYRLTPQRQLVLQAVRDLRHATPEAIAAEVRRTAPGVNITTVYRTLELLEELGLVTHAHLDHGAPAYHPADNEHVHVVCRVCNTVSDAPVEMVADVVARMASERGFTVDASHITLFGTCSACSVTDDRVDGSDSGSPGAAGAPGTGRE
ncbi:MAG TPA: transcriptional repressor [Mycobacteriales bacterium]